MATPETPVTASARLLPPLPARGRLPWWQLTLNGAREAFRGLTTHTLRSALALLALVVGVAAVLLVLTVNQTVQRMTAGGFAGVGANLITVQGFVVPASAIASAASGRPVAIRCQVGAAGCGSPSLTLQDVQTLRQLPHVIAANPSGADTVVQAVAGDHNLQTIATGAFPDLQLIRSYTLHAGSFFSEADVDRSAAVAVLGRGAATKLFPGATAVGQQVRLNNVNFTVVGVLNTVGSNDGNVEMINNVQLIPDDNIIVPVSTWQQRLQGQEPGGKGETGSVTTSGKRPGGQAPPKPPANAVVVALSAATPSPSQRALQGATFPMVQVEVDGTSNVSMVRGEIKQVLEKNHHIQPGDQDDFQIDPFLAAAEAAQQSLETVELAMGIMAVVALLLGGFGVANVLLASVSERTREIGLRLAVGAEPADIRRQFLIEAVTLSLLGGLGGSAVGLALMANLGRLLGGQGGVAPTPVAIGAGLGVALVLGLLFGSYPARRAARLDPIQALRRN